MHKITRIAYNSADWQRPTGDARKYEAAGTYNHDYGFGHEDWLFRSDWTIDGWRYAFIQGVNKGRTKLLRDGKPIDLTLFTIQPDKKRRYVATIDEVECLDDQQAEDALGVFKKQGWYSSMLKEIVEADGDPSALGRTEWAKHILNVRFRLENVNPFPQGTYALPGEAIIGLTRYQLYDATIDNPASETSQGRKITGATSLPTTKPFVRRAFSAVVCTPEHARMQKKLMVELRAEYPKAHVVREQNFIDVSVQTLEELILFEIKSDLEPRTVIRQALGQILEYAYHPSRTHDLPVQLVIVGRRPLSPLEATYLEHLKSEFSLPLSYRVVEL